MTHADDIVHLTRLGIAGKHRDVAAYARRIARRERNDDPELSQRLTKLLRETGNLGSVFRNDTAPAAAEQRGEEPNT